MKLTDFIQDVGRPATYYPSLRKITGSTNATLFLCQLIYWRGKEADPNGWVYKTAEDMETETGLSYDEQKTARAKLKEAGLLDEHYARLDHQMKYRVNLEAVNEKWGETKQPVRESGITALGKATLPDSLNESESTTENTTEPSSLSSSDLQEVTIAANKKMDVMLEFERLAQEANANGQDWRGRELLPTQYLVYGDWWYAKTGQEMYGAKGKPKMDSSWLTAFKAFWEFDVSISSLDAALAKNEWRKPITLIQIVADAKAFQAAGALIADAQPQREEGKGFYA